MSVSLRFGADGSGSFQAKTPVRAAARSGVLLLEVEKWESNVN